MVKEVVVMDLEIETIERLVGERLRRLWYDREDEEEKDIYTEEGILDLEDSGEISVAESGFMQGYLKGQ